MSRPSRARPGARSAVAAAIGAALLSGCAVPVPEAPTAAPAEGPGGAGPELTVSDPGGEVLAAQLAVLDAAVAAVAAALDDAAAAGAADDGDAARAAGAKAVRLLIGADAGTGGTAASADTDVPALLPTAAPDRAGGGSGDLLTATVTLAGDVGGERARVVLELLRDPMVGDLGAWQRDAPGVIGGLRSAVATAGADPAALDTALAGTSGELTRTLGYALAVAEAPDAALAAHAARAGTARLEVVRIALELGAASISGTAG